LALTGPSTAAGWIGSGLEAAGICAGGLVVILALAPATNPSQHVCSRVPAAGMLTGQRKTL
jgi:hypothetical protein